jgi:ABC-type transport system substrate-binding protein/class 3 adenylate cyclase
MTHRKPRSASSRRPRLTAENGERKMWCPVNLPPGAAVLEDDHSPAPTSEPGIRTFLIADVRGYTRYTQEHGDEEAARLAASFAEIVEGAVAESDGRLVELRGDEALVAFGSPRDAIRTAVALQHRFVERMRAADPLPLRVGIGIDAGEAVPVGGGYRGGALNLAARLCSLAQPGEVLVSEGLAHLARKVDDTSYVDRGRVSVKGLSQRVRVYQVAFPLDMPADEPRSRAARTTALLTAGAVAAVAVLGLVVAFLITGFAGSDPPTRIKENAVAAIDAAGGKLVSQTPVGNGPTAVATGLGSVWVANSVDGTVSRILPDRDERPVIRVTGTPGGLAVGEDAVWVTDATGHTLSQISPDSNTVVREDIAVGNGAGAIAVGEGAVWVANTLDGTVSRVDPERGVETDVVRVAGRPDALAVGARSIWVANGDTASVSRIDPGKRLVVQTIPVGNGPRGITLDGGTVWVANALDGTVSKIAAATGTVSQVGAVAAGVSSIAISGGAVWASSPPAGKVFRIDRGTAQVTDAIEMGTSPSALAAGTGDTLWAAALSPTSRHRGGTLLVSAYLSGCNCLDPAFAWQSDAWRALSILYDGLVTYRKTSGAPGATLVPDLALNLPVPTDEGRTYRFQLRSGLRYSDGSPVRASDFRASMERLLRLNGVNLPPFYGGIVGAESCSAESGRCDLRKGIEVDDAQGTIAIHLSAPDPDLLAKLALPFAFVLPADAPEPDHPLTDPARFDAVGDYTIPGTGPYAAASFNPQRELRLERNPHFKLFSTDAQPAGYPDQILIRVLGDGNAPDLRSAVGAVEAGKSDWTTQLSPEEVKRLAVGSAAQLHTTPIGGVQHLMLSMRKRPFSDVRARQALAYAIDRNRLVELAGGELVARPSCQVLPPIVPGYRPYCPYTVNPSAGVWSGPDLARARSLAAKSHTLGESVTIAIPPDDPYDQRLGKYVAGVLRQVGYRASVRVEPDIFASMLAPKSDVNAIRVGWLQDFAAPSNFIEPLFTCSANEQGGVNVSQFCSRRVDALVSQARTPSDVAATADAWARIDRLLVDQAPAIPLYALREADFVSKRVGNYIFNPQFGVLLDQLWVQ